MSTEIPQVRRRKAVRRWVGFEANPTSPDAVPLRIKAVSDDLPDDEDEAVLDFVVHVQRMPYHGA